MKVSDLDFEFPLELIAKTPVYPPRVLLVQETPREISWDDVLGLFKKNDILVVNNTKVMPRRVFAKSLDAEIEILFLNSTDGLRWEVLFPSKKFKVGDEIALPGGVSMTLVQKGRPQVVLTSGVLDSKYFESFGELPLPPYIQKARGERHTVAQDKEWYQTSWAQKSGSFAAPTASLHFQKKDLQILRERGVKILEITLHVGLGTFLPVEVEDLDQHVMHSEEVEVSLDVWNQIQNRESGSTVWALGTTVARSLESVALGKVPLRGSQYMGPTDLLIQPGYQFQVVQKLMTNFHLPQSTLLALAYAFAGKEKVQKAYKYAIENKMRFFSYGDLSIL